MTPLFLKFWAGSGNCYIYDVPTNEIIQAGGVVCAIIDDFGILDTHELIEKHQSLGEDSVRRALVELEQLQFDGILREHLPRLCSKAGQVRCDGLEQRFDEFLENQRRLLILELTQKCNLACEYCCYGHHYLQSGQRRESVLPLETAQRVIRDFVNHRLKRCSIGFYGGEPLLEFELLKQVVCFAEECAGQRGMKPEFSVTTNGTLLTDERIHFLVEHNFSVVVSIDGPKETHDRYRVFQDGLGGDGRRGSFDIVIKNVRRFAELYPDYGRRGFAITLTAISDVDAIDSVLRDLQPYYPSMSATFVRDIPHVDQENTGTVIGRIGSFGKLPCEVGGCGRESLSHQSDKDSSESMDGQCATSSAPLQTVPEFCNWTQEWWHRYSSSCHNFRTRVCEHTNPNLLQNSFPVSYRLFAGTMRNLHTRRITRWPVRVNFGYLCYPGAARTFCSADGLLFPCERTETGDLFKLGDAENGIDVERALRLTEKLRVLSDCGNCVSKRTCSFCPAVVVESGDSGMPDALTFQAECRQRIGSIYTALSEYVALMEANQGAADSIIGSNDSDDDWLGKVEFLLDEEQQKSEVELEVEELEEMV